MPLVTRGFNPLCENRLREGWLLEIATSKLKISMDEAVGLLLAACADAQGAVEIEPAS